MSASLTIAIPTYNRAGHVEARLREIIPQLTEGMCLHVFDNCSTDNTAEVVASFKHPALRYSCSRQNMGMCRNICRGLEEAETEWVWILGDDDPITPNAVSVALRWINETKATVIQFDSLCGKIDRYDLISTVGELYARYDPTLTLYISSLLFKVPPLRKLYLVLSAAIFTYAPHTALIVRMLEMQSGSMELRPERLLREYGGRRWSTLEVALGISLLPEFVLDRKMQEIAARNIRMEVCWMFVYGLREVRDEASALKYRRTVRQSLANLSCYGARRFALGSVYRKPSRKDRKDFLLATLISMLPLSIIIRLGARMRAKYIREGEVLGEFQ